MYVPCVELHWQACYQPAIPSTDVDEIQPDTPPQRTGHSATLLDGWGPGSGSSTLLYATVLLSQELVPITANKTYIYIYNSRM